MKYGTITTTLDDIIEVELEYQGYYMPAKIDGPVENCYPAEGSCDWQVLNAWIELKDGTTILPFNSSQLKTLETVFNSELEETAWNAILEEEEP